jgi:hypothetical protein
MSDFLSRAQFWRLIERWDIPDAAALGLIDFAGEIGKSGKRPRFRFTPQQKQLTAYLAAIDAALTAIGHDSEWLGKRNRASPFLGQTPFTFMVENGEEGIAETLQFLNKMVLRLALRSR